MSAKESKPIWFNRYRARSWETINAGVVVEKAVSLTVNGSVWLTFMCTPSYLEALGVGFLYNEGVIDSLDDIASVKTCANEENIDIWLNFSVQEPIDWMRTSGCTGGFSTEEAEQKTKPVLNGGLISPQEINRMVNDLFENQQIYNQVGGVHTSILSDGANSIIMAEDIGRHNTLDKISGRYLLEQVEFRKKIIISTGRISSDMLQKSARIGAPIVVSRTSPSSLSIELAEKFGITLIGYARRNGFNIYTNDARIDQTDSNNNLIIENQLNRLSHGL